MLCKLMAQLVANESEAPELASALHVGAKVVWSCMYTAVPDVMVKGKDLARVWLQVHF